MFVIVNLTRANTVQSTISVGLNETAKLTCSVGPFLQPTWDNVLSVRWTRSNDAFIAKKKKRRIGFFIDDAKYDIPSMPLLSIRDIQLSDDGIYKCVVLYEDIETGEKKQKHYSVTVVAHVPFHLALNPSDEAAYNTTTFLRSTSLTLVCSATFGRPQAIITWYRNGWPIENVRDISIQTNYTSANELFNTTSHLTITQLNERQEGNYTCRASNELNSYEERHFFVAVDDPGIAGSSTKERTVLSDPVLLGGFVTNIPVKTKKTETSFTVLVYGATLSSASDSNTSTNSDTHNSLPVLIWSIPMVILVIATFLIIVAVKWRKRSQSGSMDGPGQNELKLRNGTVLEHEEIKLNNTNETEIDNEVDVTQHQQLVNSHGLTVIAIGSHSDQIPSKEYQNQIDSQNQSIKAYQIDIEGETLLQQDRWEIDRKMIKFTTDILGSGEFGEVRLAELIDFNDCNGNRLTEVAVKFLKGEILTTVAVKFVGNQCTFFQKG
ncbi:uncharacterized protein LOC144448664 [Glandiceps talaboti]